MAFLQSFSILKIFSGKFLVFLSTYFLLMKNDTLHTVLTLVEFLYHFNPFLILVAVFDNISF